ncbi:MAG TPA: hypothetical protein VM598_05295 [Bdellovibrionota bacterium]|nr:hypothetical protein [Bdellovibrionota bacterium]
MSRLKPAAVLIAVTFLISSSAPKPAHAVIGLGAVAPASIGYLLAAGASIGVGAPLTYLCISLSDQNPSYQCEVGEWVMSVGLLALGILLLDEGSGPALKFAPVSAESSRELGLTQDEAADYNDSIDEINAIAGQVAHELASLERPTVEDSRRAWERLATRLPSRATADAIAKVSANWLAGSHR